MENLTFENALAQLESLTEKLKDELPLAEALALYEQGVALAGACQKMLDEAQRRIEVLQPDGQCIPYSMQNEPFKATSANVGDGV